MKNRLRLAHAVTAVVAVAILVACGSDSSTSQGSSSASVGSAASTVTNDTPSDFGSAYIGQPVAFWFWAPY